jgi:hypothetical protein
VLAWGRPGTSGEAFASSRGRSLDRSITGRLASEWKHLLHHDRVCGQGLRESSGRCLGDQAHFQRMPSSEPSASNRIIASSVFKERMVSCSRCWSLC